LAYANHPKIYSWNQPVLSNNGRVSGLRKQPEPLMGLKLTTDRSQVSSSTHCPLLVPVALKKDYFIKCNWIFISSGFYSEILLLLIDWTCEPLSTEKNKGLVSKDKTLVSWYARHKLSNFANLSCWLCERPSRQFNNAGTSSACLLGSSLGKPIFI